MHIRKRYLAAVATTLCAMLLTPGHAVAADDIVIADFEGADYGAWKVEGEAFGKQPAAGTLPGQMDVSGFRGKHLVNSFNGGDGTTGTLTSPPFTIERPFINFLIGGGMHPNETCINLIVDGQPVRTATGPNDRPGGTERLRWASWDVTDFQGKTAQIQIVDTHTGSWGHINIDQICQSEKTTVLPDLEKTMRIEKQYLNLPVKNGAEMRHMTFAVDGRPECQFDIQLADTEPDFWAFIDVRAFKGKDAQLHVNQPPESNPQALDAVTQTNAIEGAGDLYNEKLRPQFHFSSRRGWNNDPNGLVYYGGECFLFYQHNPFGVQWGNMHWGEAVSKDLVHWEELPDALHPDKLGTMFSGSAVVDWNNTAGFQTGSKKVIVCIYTAAGGTSPESADQPFTQCIAYSNDRGRTWTKYDGNPVLRNVKGANRDPKVLWHEPSKTWIMALYLDANDYALFGSPNLREWTKLCDVPMPGASECPDFYELPVDGDAKNTRWLFWGANGTYALGTFDGKTFTRKGELQRFDWGGSTYAAQTYSDIPKDDGRRIQVAWMRVDLPGMQFNQMMGFPCELTLRTTPDGIRLHAQPVREIETLRAKKYDWKNETIQPGKNLLADVSGELFDIRAEFEVGNAAEFGFTVRGVPVVYNVAKQELACRDKVAPLKPIDGKVRIQILADRPSLEVFGNDGLVYLPLGVIPEDNATGLALFSKGDSTKLNDLVVYGLKSAWR